jgi:uncharacterized protein GlcG (DUF336 family)
MLVVKLDTILPANFVYGGVRKMKSVVICVLALSLNAERMIAFDDDDDNRDNCRNLPTAAQLRQHLNRLDTVPVAIGGMIGGLFNGARMWAAVTDRDGEICAVVTSTQDTRQVWPGSQAIAKAKAYTANAFSLDTFVLSTARLYTFTQPGHSLWSLGQSNLFDPDALAVPGARAGKEKLAGGLIFFGGGVPLYREGRIVGGLGISGDTSCADHEVAKRVRHLAGLNPPGGPTVDDIVYSGFNPAAEAVFTHPKCINTYRNGVLIGQEAAPIGY